MASKHLHHIVPKHMGGSNDPMNLIELTIEEHAEAHRELWEYCGRLEDYIAWKTLSGQISKAEATILAIKNANTGREGYWKGKDRNEETKRKISLTNQEKGIKPPSRKGVKKSEEEKQKHREAFEKVLTGRTKEYLSEITRKGWETRRKNANKKNKKEYNNASLDE